jgi:DNA mismatch repair protein MutL
MNSPAIIQLLPDSLANQIAAGEVVQRPASVVKELLENAIDAGATFVHLIIRDAGKTLIQVIDNGSGMYETDARLCFERHATSKIKTTEDLFKIRTMGFRGEALASIAAVAQVELKTKRANDELGTRILIEGSEVKLQEPTATAVGTNIAVKNLFYNVPARRKFLKQNAQETKHIIDEFQRVALANFKVGFQLTNTDHIIYNLKATEKLSQRILNLLGNEYLKHLIPCQEETILVKVKGYIGTPSVAKKTKTDQFFFVNGRFIKSAYLHHAVMRAYGSLIEEGKHPFYVLMLEVNPEDLDVNIHPTKTEVKFENEQAVYTIVEACLRQALSVYSMSAGIDFEAEIDVFSNFIQKTESYNTSLHRTDETPKQPQQNQWKIQRPSKINTDNLKNWQKLYEYTSKDNLIQQFEQESEANTIFPESETIQIASSLNNADEQMPSSYTPPALAVMMLHNKYVLYQTKSGLMLINKQLAYERILYEQYSFSTGNYASQQLMFPQTITLNVSDVVLLEEIQQDLLQVGIDINILSKNAITIIGIPPEVLSVSYKDLLEDIVEQYKNGKNQVEIPIKHHLSSVMAKRGAAVQTPFQNTEQIQQFIARLFACKQPAYTPDGLPILTNLSLPEIEKLFD